MTQTATIQAQQRWEYLELSRKSDSYLTSDMNEAGQEGWELVAITHGKDRKGEAIVSAFLKRPFVAPDAPPAG